MSSDAIELLLRALDEPAPAWDGGGVRDWPPGHFERLRGLGLLVPGPAATHVVCPNCEHGHLCPVTYLEDRPYVACVEGGVVNIDPASLRTWVPDRGAVAALLRKAIQATDRFRELVPGRLWQLGTVRWEGVSRKMMLAMGLHWPDGAKVAMLIGVGGKPIVLVPSAPPARDIWPELEPAVAPLTDLLVDTADIITIDSAGLLSIVREADQLNAASMQGALADPKFRKAIARGVNAGIKRHLTDSELLKAHELCGSADKAVAWFAAQGIKVHRNRIYRALDREQKEKLAGEKGAVAEPSRVPSHKRDKPGK